VADHRAEGRESPRARAAAGIATLALAALGAVSLVPQAVASAPVPRTLTATVRGHDSTGTADPGTDHATALWAQASVRNGVISSGTRGRTIAVSRDTERQALQNAVSTRLQPAGGAQARQQNAALAALAASAEKHANALAMNAWQLPIPSGQYQLTARFGEISGLWAHFHTGLDFAAPTGTPIHAVANGVITSAGWAGAYGNRTVETLPDGTELWYAHQSQFGVRPGEHVVAGQVIGLVGATGNVTGPHLHLEVRPGAGDPVDPFNALVAHGLRP
jgi:murein DD-endopeptidase MepM/ murein hydrolase activator NlpD